MSLIIEGMKMPEFRDVHGDGRGTVYLLMLTVNKDGTAYLHANTDDNEFHQVKELPTPHGRLIDADSLIEYINKELKGDEYIQRMFRRIVKSRPTVIEAEAGE